MTFATTKLKAPLKWTAFVVLSMASFIYLHSYYTWPVLVPVATPEEAGVSIGYDPATKMMTVTMDGKSEIVSLTNAESSTFYKQATERVGVIGLEKLRHRQTEVKWDRMIVRWVTFELILCFIVTRI
jgi:hypothetical protein